MGSSSYHRDEDYIKNQELFRNYFLVIFKKVLTYKKHGSILEIGSSTGLLLEIFKKYRWKVQGVEPSKKSSDFAIKRGIPTIQQTFEKANITSKYDVVVLNHVLEHLKNPHEVLKKVHKLLNKGGIVIVNVPNAGSLSAQIFGEKWEYVLPDEHLWQFTPKSLEKLLQEEGVNIVSWDAKSGIWELYSPSAEIWQALVGGKKRFFRDVITAIPSWVITKLKRGTGLSVIAQKM